MANPVIRTTTRLAQILIADADVQIAKKCRQEGLRAGRDGRQAHDCPYDEGAAEAIEWLVGWASS